MTTRLPLSYPSSSRPSDPAPSRPPFSDPPKPSTSTNRPRSSYPPDQIDLSQIEIVDLTELSPNHTRRPRPSDSPSSERPSKRSKGKDKETYISLEDDEPSSPSPPPLPLAGERRDKSPSSSGLLSLYKCVICLDSPTDLVATPCGHLFCDFCIRSALKSSQAGRGRGVPPVYSGPCPICRGKITTKSLIPLEIKVRTLG